MTNFSKRWNVFLVNLPDRKDRLRTAEKELDKIGWRIGPGEVTLFAATRFSDAAGFPTPSVRGAFHSHSECLRAALRDSRCVMLLEDDITFARCFPELLPRIAANLEEISWDFCYLGHEQTGQFERGGARTREVSLLPYQGSILGLHFCLINRRILPRLLNHLDRLASGRAGDDDYGPMPIDGALNTFRRLNSDVCTLIAVPKMGWQRPSRSDITPRFFDQLNYLRPVFTALRAVKAKLIDWRF